MEKKVSDYITQEEKKEFDKEFKQFFKSKSKQKRGELKININRFKQTFRVIANNFFVLFDILKKYPKLLFTKDIPLRSLEIALTYKCNATCEQCSCRLAYDPKKKRLSINEFKRVIDESIGLGAFQFNITGGEPLLYEEECFELIDHIHKKNKYIHLCSNAILMDLSLLKKLKRAGLNSLEMGLDSADEKIHNGNRKENSYQKILETIANAKKVGLNVIILNTVITHEKIRSGDMLALMKLAKEQNVIMQITPPCVTGAWKNKMDILLNNEERIYLRWLLSRFSHSRMDTYSSFFGIRCPAAREKVGIWPYGEVVSCPLIQIVYGNVKNDSLENIRNKMLENPYYHQVSRDGCLPSFNKEFINEYMIDKNAKCE